VHVATRVLHVVRLVEPVLRRTREVRNRIDAAAANPSPTVRATVADVRAQVDSLVGPGFVARTGEAHLGDLDRYLRGVLVRLDRAPTNAREDVLQASIDRVETAFADLLDGGLDPATDAARDLARQIEELRVSLFAQSLGTPRPVSEKRVLAAIHAAAP
jgi:ATP-dependent helicase HrpA